MKHREKNKNILEKFFLKTSNNYIKDWTITFSLFCCKKKSHNFPQFIDNSDTI